jgi:hypothetical protein
MENNGSLTIEIVMVMAEEEKIRQEKEERSGEEKRGEKRKITEYSCTGGAVMRKEKIDNDYEELFV